MRRTLQILLLLLLPVPVLGQTGYVTGTALDAIGNTVAGATITVCPQGSPGIPCSPVTASTTSNGQGAFSVGVPFGTYTVTVFRTGIVSTSSTVVVAPSNITISSSVTYNGAVTFNNNATVAGTLTVSGAATTCIINGMYVAGSSCYPTIQAAINAAGTTGAWIAPANQAADAYSNPNVATGLALRNGQVGLYSGNAGQNVGAQIGPDYPTGNFPLGGDLNITTRGPADLYLRHNNLAATTTTATLSVGANTNVLVGSIANFASNTIGNNIQIGRNTANNEFVSPSNWSPVNQVSISSISEAGNTVTVTTTSTCGFTTGTVVAINAVPVGGYNVTATVLTPGCNGGSSFTYTSGVSGLASSSGAGIVFDATHINVTCAKSHSGTTDIEQLGVTHISTGSGGLQLVAEKPSQSSLLVGVTSLTDGGGNSVLYLPTSTGDPFPHQSWGFAEPLTGVALNSATGADPATLIFRNASAGTTIQMQDHNGNDRWDMSDTAVDQHNLSFIGGLIQSINGNSIIGYSDAGVTPKFSLNGLNGNATFSGNFTVGAGAAVTSTGAGGTMAATIASGTATMTTAAIAAGNCGATVTVSASGVLTTDSIYWSFNAAPAGSNAGLVSWPTANNVNFAYCPNSAETPAAATINWRVVR